jgi:hypothetical protein
MPATSATCRHQSPAVLSVYGFAFTSSHGCAPRWRSVCRKHSTLARYCAFVADHGTASQEPNSSFSAMTGFEQSIDCAA